ncbi:MAG TPA: methyltransferase domain-containing protein [Candidatus Eisenbacteria bacterium]|nr:methyltransferase domain-containing protein [Candidatus Eisenbacteria bacterium]
MTGKGTTWNSELYQSSHAFVWEFGRDLLTMLVPKSGERILDVGCGTGELTAEIAKSGAEVIGLDQSPEMIAAARQNYPEVHFEVADIAATTYQNEFDAVFSNAALHWVRNQEGAIAAIAQALKPGGRLVFEMGGRGNIRHIWNAATEALVAMGVENPEKLSPWFYPSIGEYAPMLEARGLLVTFAVLFDRPTPLEGGEQGLRGWLEMFGMFARDVLTPEQGDELMQRIETLARPNLFHGGGWTIDYKRLRMIAAKQ